MAAYQFFLYFHVRRGDQFIRDPDGAGFDDRQAARDDAVEAARELAAELVKFGEIVDGQIEITNDRGQILDVLPLSAVVNVNREVQRGSILRTIPGRSEVSE